VQEFNWVQMRALTTEAFFDLRSKAKKVAKAEQLTFIFHLGNWFGLRIRSQ
jgi:hypothetical protein